MSRNSGFVSFLMFDTALATH